MLTLELITQQQDYTFSNSITLDVVNHVHKRIESFNYLDDIKANVVALDYFESQILDSKYNLFIADRSYQVAANAIRKIDNMSGLVKITANSYSSAYSNLLISNQVFIDEIGRERPLFYKHILPIDTVSVQLESIVSGNNNVVETGYKVSLEDNCVYTNYQNLFDPRTGAYVLYFLNITSLTGQQKVLLSPVSVVQEAQWQDIDLATGELYSTLSVYTKEKNSSGYTFYFNKSDTWWIKPQKESLLNCILPAGRDSSDPWYVRISNGDITTIVNRSVRRYWLPEYLTQPYQPSFPYIFSNYNKLIFIDKRVVAATRGSLAVSVEENRHINLYIYDFNQILIKAWTTDLSKKDLRYSDTGIFWETDKVLCCDNRSGIIVLTEDILPSWQIFGEYYYAAEDLEIQSINLNPIQNKNLLNQTVVFYIIPNVTSMEKALQYLIVEADGRISFCSQAHSISYPNLQLFENDGSYNVNTIIGLKYISDIETNTFVTLYTAGYENTFAYLILGEVNLIDRSSVAEAEAYDVRVKGNSLINFDTDLFNKNPKALQSRYGYGDDGAIIPLNNVVVIQAPLTLLIDYGGALEKVAAEEHMKKNLVAGTLPLIEWTYPYSDIFLDTSLIGQISISWTWEGPDYNYRLYRRFNSTAEWILLYDTTSSTRANLEYIDTMLTSNDTVYYELRISLNDIEFPAFYSCVAKVR